MQGSSGAATQRNAHGRECQSGTPSEIGVSLAAKLSRFAGSSCHEDVLASPAAVGGGDRSRQSHHSAAAEVTRKRPDRGKLGRASNLPRKAELNAAPAGADSGSLMTRRWSKGDSNRWSPVKTDGLF